MAAEHCITRLLGGDIATTVTQDRSEFEITAVQPNSMQPTRALGNFMRSGDVMLIFDTDPNGRDPNIAPPDSEGTPDPKMAAVLYLAAGLRHPYAQDGAVGDIKVSTPGSSSEAVMQNLGALGVMPDFKPNPNLDDGNQRAWADNHYPNVPAKWIIHTFAEQFEPPAPTSAPQ